MKTIAKKRSKSEDRHMNADPKIEVKLLRSQSGQVIFLETGRDFVELLFAIMNAPLSRLISNSSSKGVQNDLHPFLDLKESLQNLGPQSFTSGKEWKRWCGVHTKDLHHKGVEGLGQRKGQSFIKSNGAPDCALLWPSSVTEGPFSWAIGAIHLEGQLQIHGDRLLEGFGVFHNYSP